MADHVCGHGFKYDCRVGFSAEERSQLQTIVVDFDARTDWRACSQMPAPTIVDYAKIDRAISALLSGREWRLIEVMAEAIAELICTGFPVDQVQVTVTKQPVDMAHCDGVSVRFSRTPADYVAL